MDKALRIPVTPSLSPPIIRTLVIGRYRKYKSNRLMTEKWSMRPSIHVSNNLRAQKQYWIQVQLDAAIQTISS